MTHYFEMMDDVRVPGRWFLGDPVDRNGNELNHALVRGQRLQVTGSVRVRFNEFAPRGKPIDYCELDSFTIPFVHARVAHILNELAASDIQLLPAEIEGQPDQFYIVNILKTIQCLDIEKSSHVEVLGPEDEAFFPGRVGQYRSVRGMRIDPTKVEDARVFRPWGWKVAIIVSEEVREALEQIGTVGVKFAAV